MCEQGLGDFAVCVGRSLITIGSNSACTKDHDHSRAQISRRIHQCINNQRNMKELNDHEDPAQLTSLVYYMVLPPLRRSKKRSRQELMQWHPDKVVSRYGSRLYAQDRTSILDKVNGISQLLNTINSAV